MKLKMNFSRIIFVLILLVVVKTKRRDYHPERVKCPVVKSVRMLDIAQLQGFWYVIKYYASSEEYEIYRCMRTNFSLSDQLIISMEFTYTYKDDPDNEHLHGNITWRIPDLKRTSHWTHSEDIYEGIYNTYVLDLDDNADKSWLLLLHCAEKSGSNRYLSSFIMSRQSTLPPNVIMYLQDKLPPYDVDLQYLFNMDQRHCTSSFPPFYHVITNIQPSKRNKHPLKHPEHN